MTARCEAWRYSFLAEAAAEARTASRKYWAKGGPADREYPQQPLLAWPLVAAPVELDLVERRRRRIRRER